MTLTSFPPRRARAAGSRRLLAALARRWPTALALVFGANSFFGEVTGSTTRAFSEVLIILPLLYVIVAATAQRRATWLVLIAILAGYVGLRMQDLVDPTLVVLAAALAATIWGAGHGRHRERDVKIQLAGMVAFGAIAIAGQLVDVDIARYLVALGWIGHGVWDFVHLAKDRVVSRSFAEWCGVVDVLIGSSLIIVPLL